ncbi:MAG: 16S rRNA (cytosine(967)-C(5))-methyltransferase RsmB [candidate division KSB1 bacterium]|nr:16S rRNA (cytosine(967)-C(5))-methyltransferase RsmB [candidate division KSB1 bacterium]
MSRTRRIRDPVLDSIMKQNPLSGQDNAFLNEIVRGTIRWKNRLDWIVKQRFKGKSADMPLTVRWILWLGIYQVLFTHTPPFAAVNESVNLVKQKKYMRWTGVVNGLLRNLIRHPDAVRYPNPDKDPVAYLSITQSHPEWLVKKWIKELGYQETQQLCQANNQPAGVTLRVNPRIISEKALIERLHQKGIQLKSTGLSGYYHVIDNQPKVLNKFLHAGMLSIQDMSAGLPVRLIDVVPGDVILDVCGAPGGKSAALAERWDEQCQIVSGDISPGRSKLIESTLKRLNLQHVYPVTAAAQQFPALNVDTVLLDAPCSGLGVLQRKADIRWQRKPTDIYDLSLLQKDLINAAASHVKPGGQLVYSTCTVLREENEDIVHAFLTNHPEFTLKPATNIPDDCITQAGFVRTWPHKHAIDGSFAAKFIRKE